MATLEELRTMIPQVECKGMCHAACSIVACSNEERERLGSIPNSWPDNRCPLLTADNRCSVYEERPLICRAYGAVEGMPCEHGCEPKGGRLSDEKAHKILRVPIVRSGIAMIHPKWNEVAQSPESAYCQKEREWLNRKYPNQE